MKVTKWYPGYIKPVRKGVYQQDSASANCTGYQYWNGKFWGGWCSSPEGAYQMRHQKVHEAFSNDPWRGLTEEVK